MGLLKWCYNKIMTGIGYALAIYFIFINTFNNSNQFINDVPDTGGETTPEGRLIVLLVIAIYAAGFIFICIWDRIPKGKK